MKYRIVLLPPPPIVKKAIFMSRSLKRKGGLFLLNKTDAHAHITLATFTVRASDTPRVLGAIERIAFRTKPARLMSRGIVVYPSGYVAVGYKNTPVLRALRRKIVVALSTLDSTVLDRHFFDPHITLIKFRANDRRAHAQTRVTGASFTSHMVAVFVSGKWGRCTKEVTRFSLQQ